MRICSPGARRTPHFNINDASILQLDLAPEKTVAILAAGASTYAYPQMSNGNSSGFAPVDLFPIDFGSNPSFAGCAASGTMRLG